MKTLRFLFGIVALMAVLISCNKDEQTSPIEIDLSKSAVLKGKVFAELNTTNEILDFAPSGTKILFSIDASQFSGRPSFSENDLIYETTVGSNGDYQITLPVTEEGVSIVIIPVDFEYDQIYQYYNNEGQLVTGTHRVVYSSDAGLVGVVANQVRIIDIQY